MPKKSAQRAIHSLNPRRQAFVKSYISPQTLGNATQAYKAGHLGITQGSAEVLGSKTLGNLQVKEAIGEELEHLGWGVEDLKRMLAEVHSKAKTKQNLARMESVLMNYAKLTGQLIEKSEVTVTQQQREAARQAVVEALEKDRDN